MTIRVFTVDDLPSWTGIGAMIANEQDMTVVAEAGDGAAAVDAYLKLTRFTVPGWRQRSCLLVNSRTA